MIKVARNVKEIADNYEVVVHDFSAIENPFGLAIEYVRESRDLKKIDKKTVKKLESLIEHTLDNAKLDNILVPSVIFEAFDELGKHIQESVNYNHHKLRNNAKMLLDFAEKARSFEKSGIDEVDVFYPQALTGMHELTMFIFDKCLYKKEDVYGYSSIVSVAAYHALLGSSTAVVTCNKQLLLLYSSLVHHAGECGIEIKPASFFLPEEIEPGSDFAVIEGIDKKGEYMHIAYNLVEKSEGLMKNLPEHGDTIKRHIENIKKGLEKNTQTRLFDTSIDYYSEKIDYSKEELKKFEKELIEIKGNYMRFLRRFGFKDD